MGSSEIALNYVMAAEPQQTSDKIDFFGVHHIGILCEDLKTSLDFYQGTLGMILLALIICKELHILF